MQSTPTEPTPELVEDALAGDPAAQGRLIDALTPTIQIQVAKMLRRWQTGDAGSRDLHQEVADLVQEVFLELLEDDAKTLRRWDPERLPLVAYVGYIAKIRTAEVLRSRRSPWREDPRDVVDLDRPSAEVGPEAAILSRDHLRKIHLCLLAGFGIGDSHLFELLVVRELELVEVVERSGKSADAVYKWRSRLYAKAKACRDRLSRIAASPQRRERG